MNLKQFKVFFLMFFVCVFCAHSVFADCVAGWGIADGECVKCPAGWYSPGGTSECKKCGGGRYSSSAGSSGCTKCLPGTYASEPEENSVNTSCYPCPNGQYQDNEGQSYCKVCGKQPGNNDLHAPYVTPDRTTCMACPPGNCCYNYGAYVCKKGTYSDGDVACKADEAFISEVPVCPVQQRGESNATGGSGTIEGGDGGGHGCSVVQIPAFGVRKGVCTPCTGGKTTAGKGAISSSECNIQSASSFSGNGGSFSWPDDGSVLEQDINLSNVSSGNHN